MRRSWAMIVKEWKSIARRDLVFLVLIQPLVFCLIWGFCASLDLRRVSVAVLDGERSNDSRGLVRALEQTGRFEVTRRAADPGELERALTSGEARAGLVISPSFVRDLRRGRGGSLKLIVDGTDPVVATTGLGYAVASVQAALRGPPAPASVRAWYNPSLRSVDLLLLGAICYNLMFFAVYPATSLLTERDAGTMIPLSASPATTFEVWLGMIVPNGLVAMWGSLVQIGLMIFVAGVPFHGQPWLLIGTLALFTFIHLNLGCLLALASGTVARLTVLNLIVTLVFMVFSGFLLPVSYLPGWAQQVGALVPLTHGLVLVRAVYQKAAGWEAVAGQLQILAIFAAVTTVAGIAAVHSLLNSTRG